MQLLKLLRVIVTSAAATVVGLANAARRGDDTRVRLRIGDIAPDFSLAGSDGQVHTLSTFRGRQAVVLAWFPKAFTGGCTRQCGSMESHRAIIDTFDVAMFGANVDDADTNRRFAAAFDIRFPLLSDPDTTAARAYGVLGRSGFPSRWTFFIGANGRILAIDERGETSTHGMAIERTLAALGVSRRPQTPPALDRPVLTR